MVEGNRVLDYFHLLKKNNLIGTSYLFVGEDYVKVSDVVKLINCQQDSSFCNTCWDCRKIDQNNHPDLLIVEPENFTIKINQIRESIRFLSLKNFRLTTKVIIVKDAQNLNITAANAFLKTLEEPPKNSLIAVCAPKLDSLLPTIISRCRKIFLPLRDERGDKKLNKSEANLVSGFLKGERVVFKDRKRFSSFLWNLIFLLRSNLIAKASQRNNRLSFSDECEIILRPYSVMWICDILGGILRIYGARDNINMNLALSLIRTQINELRSLPEKY